MTFSVLRALGLVLRTWPFLVVRVVVSTIIGFCYAFAAVIGAGLGWSVGQLWEAGSGAPGALVGGLLGLCVALAGWFWVRAWLVYVVKAGHVAALTMAMDGGPLTLGFGQISFALGVVRARFLEINALFVLDQLIKGATAGVTAVAGGLVAFTRVPGLEALMGFLGAVLRMSTQFVDEIILAYALRNAAPKAGPSFLPAEMTGRVHAGGRPAQDPWNSAQDALVLYAQNGWTILGNAIALTVLTWFVWLALFVLFMAPAGAWAALAPGNLSYAGLVLSAIAAFVVTKAVIEPFCIACLLQVFVAATAGQVPDPEWRARLTQVSRTFAELGNRAADAAGI